MSCHLLRFGVRNFTCSPGFPTSPLGPSKPGGPWGKIKPWKIVIIVIHASTDNYLIVQDNIQEYLKMKINNILVFKQDVFILRMYLCFRSVTYFWFDVWPYFLFLLPETKWFQLILFFLLGYPYIIFHQYIEAIHRSYTYKIGGKLQYSPLAQQYPSSPGARARPSWRAERRSKRHK